MKRYRTIGTFLGAPVRIELSLALMCLPIAFVTAFGEGYVNPHWNHSPSWMLGLMGALIYCASIFIHEVGHLVALRHFGIQVESVTLNALGGRTKAPGKVPSAKIDLVVSVAGPACTLALTGLGFGVASVPGGAMTILVKELAITLALLNLSILPGCLIPIWPTDMYRALRGTYRSARWE